MPVSEHALSEMKRIPKRKLSVMDLVSAPGLILCQFHQKIFFPSPLTRISHAMWTQTANYHYMISHLAFLVIGESVLTFIPFMTGIAQEAIGCTFNNTNMITEWAEYCQQVYYIYGNVPNSKPQGTQGCLQIRQCTCFVKQCYTVLFKNSKTFTIAI